MLLKEFLEKLKFQDKEIEINDENGESICKAYANSRGVQPYLNYEVVQWFPYKESIWNRENPDVCVRIKAGDAE